MIHPKKGRTPGGHHARQPGTIAQNAHPKKATARPDARKTPENAAKKGGFFVFCRFAVQITVFWDRRVKRRFFGLSGLIVLTNQNRPPDAGQNWRPSRPATITDDQSQSRQKLNRTPSELR